MIDVKRIHLLFEDLDLLFIECQNKIFGIDKNKNLFFAEAHRRFVFCELIVCRYLKYDKKNIILNNVFDFMIMDVEYFYYNFDRLLSCLEQLPEFSKKLKRKFKEINIIRNGFIEHPELQSLYGMSFSYDDELGIVIKPNKKIQKRGNEYEDKGFNSNLIESLERLKKILNSYKEL